MNKEDRLIQITKEIRQLFHLLYSLSEQVSGIDVSVGQRAILEELLEKGENTIPEIARSKHVSRQHILKQVNPLEQNGYVEFVENPAHKRSFIVRLTDKGTSAIIKAKKKELKVIQSLGKKFKGEEIENVQGFLGKLKAELLELESNN